MRISDWSSDVCSSDLPGGGDEHVGGLAAEVRGGTRGDRLHRRPPAIAGEGVRIARIDDQRARRTECQRGAAPFDLGRGAFALRQHARDMGSGIERHEGEVARSEEHTSELQSLMRISYAVFCLKKKKN